MGQTLLVSGSEKANQSLAQFVRSTDRAERILTAQSGGEARRLLLEQEIGILIVNAPLPDEFGHELALHAVHTTAAGALLRQEDTEERQIDLLDSE